MFWSLNREKWATKALQIFCIYGLLSLHTFTAALMVWKDSFAQALHFIIIFFLSGCSGLVSFKENDYFFTRICSVVLIYRKMISK